MIFGGCQNPATFGKESIQFYGGNPFLTFTDATGFPVLMQGPIDNLRINNHPKCFLKKKNHITSIPFEKNMHFGR